MRVGPILARRARAAGVPYTLVDGDQPSLLVGLVSWARVLGLPIVAAGKSSEYDYVLDVNAGAVTWTDRKVSAPGLAAAWELGADAMRTIEHRAHLLKDLPHRTAPDYCEMCLVANATGLTPDRADFHAPFTRTTELPDLYIPREEGGLIGRRGVLDVFNCLRRTDDPSFAGGVFVVVELADEKTGQLFAGKGIPVSRNRRYALIYNPSHLLGVEAPISIVAAARLRHDMLDETYRPVCDLVAKGELIFRPATRSRSSVARRARARAAARRRRAGTRRQSAALLHGGWAQAPAAGVEGRVHHRGRRRARFRLGSVAVAGRPGRAVLARVIC